MDNENNIIHYLTKIDDYWFPTHKIQKKKKHEGERLIK